MLEAEEDAEDGVFYDSEDWEDADVAAELEGFDAGGVGEYVAATVADGYASEQPDMPAESVDGFAVADGRGFYPSMLVRSAALFCSDVAPADDSIGTLHEVLWHG